MIHKIASFTVKATRVCVYSLMQCNTFVFPRRKKTLRLKQLGWMYRHRWRKSILSKFNGKSCFFFCFFWSTSFVHIFFFWWMVWGRFYFVSFRAFLSTIMFYIPCAYSIEKAFRKKRSFFAIVWKEEIKVCGNVESSQSAGHQLCNFDRNGLDFARNFRSDRNDGR